MTVEELLEVLETEKGLLLELADHNFHEMKEYINAYDYGMAIEHERLMVQANGEAHRIDIAIKTIKARVS
jgi:hypothetical protein